ncbi:MAG: carbon-nitrogen hydrolase family protein [Eubacteriales bacterium]|jgi:omega-amidase
MRAALLQMPVVREKTENIDTAYRYLLRARDMGAQLAVLPEMWCCPYETSLFAANAESTPDAPARRMLSDAARELNLYIVGGSIPERDGNTLYNTSFVYAPSGEPLARHRKTYLFDIDIPGRQTYRESDVFTHGDGATVFPTPWGMLGVEICFDLRFPELARETVLKGAWAICAPSMFNPTTGPAHWELTLRARALDNQCYMLGVESAPDPSMRYVSHGHSLAVNPWGEVMCDLGDAPDVCVVEIDPEEVKRVRRELPLLSVLKR